MLESQKLPLSLFLYEFFKIPELNCQVLFLHCKLAIVFEHSQNADFGKLNKTDNCQNCVRFFIHCFILYILLGFSKCL